MIDIEKLKNEVWEIISPEDYVVIGKTLDYLNLRGYLNALPEWQPIETAPKDGGVFLICLPRMMDLIIRARFDSVHKLWLSERDTDGGIIRAEFFHPGDYWMPLPAAPKVGV